MNAVAKTEPVVPLSHDGVVPSRLVEELPDTLSSRLADGLVNRLLTTVAAMSVASMHDDGGVPRIPDGTTHANAAQLAARFQLSVQWVQSHGADLGATPISDNPNSKDLGATPISDNPNSKVRYHVATADAYMARRRRMPKTTNRTRLRAAPSAGVRRSSSLPGCRAPAPTGGATARRRTQTRVRVGGSPTGIRVTPHMFRRTAMTYWAWAERNQRWAMRHAGHKSAKMTLEAYQQSFPRYPAARAKVVAWLRGAGDAPE